MLNISPLKRDTCGNNRFFTPISRLFNEATITSVYRITNLVSCVYWDFKLAKNLNSKLFCCFESFIRIVNVLNAWLLHLSYEEMLLPHAIWLLHAGRNLLIIDFTDPLIYSECRKWICLLFWFIRSSVFVVVVLAHYASHFLCASIGFNKL